jgi:hypothetical protein
MTHRYRDPGLLTADFLSLISVRCPRCHQRASVKPKVDAQAGLFDPRRVSCPCCGYSKDWHGRQVGGGSASAPTDWYFHLPLWLQISCCGKLLWAYNRDHLDFIESYVQATWREGLPEQATAVFKNKTAASRLPKWIKKAKNRQKILKKIAVLRSTLT